MIVKLTYYTIPRDEDGRRNREFDRLFTLALRWWPEVTDDRDKGSRALGSLASGDAISFQQLQVALAYLIGAIVYYESNVPEPYPGRNAEAASNLHDLLEALQ